MNEDVVEVRLRLRSGVLLSGLLGAILVGIGLFSGSLAVLGCAAVLLTAFAFQGFRAARAAKRWRFRLRVDHSGIHLRKGPIRKLTAEEIGWSEIGAVAVLAWRSLDRRADAVIFLPPDSDRSFGQSLLAFSERVNADDPTALRRVWFSHRLHRADVSHVVAYLRAHQPQIPIHHVSG